jgi:hypothetical protein
MTDRIDLYTEAFYAVIVAEGQINEVQDELFRFSQSLEGNDELRNALSDPHYPSALRQQIVLDLLGGRATDTTLALVSLVVSTGRIKDLSSIVGALLKRTASPAGPSPRSARRWRSPTTREGPSRLVAQAAQASTSTWCRSSTPACSAASSCRSGTPSSTGPSVTVSASSESRSESAPPNPSLITIAEPSRKEPRTHG